MQFVFFEINNLCLEATSVPQIYMPQIFDYYVCDLHVDPINKSELPVISFMAAEILTTFCSPILTWNLEVGYIGLS